MATVTIEAGVLPPPSCYSSEQERLEAYVAAMIATISGGLQWETGTSEPTNKENYWLKTDSNGRPVTILKYSVADGRWVSVFNISSYTDESGGSANEYTLTFIPPYTSATAYAPGRRFSFIADFTNDGPARISVDSLAPLPIKKHGGVDLAPGDIVAGKVVDGIFDGSTFQMISPPAPPRSDSRTYTQGNNTGAALDLTITKPVGTTWQRLRLDIVGFGAIAATQVMGNVSVAVTWQTPPENGNQLSTVASQNLTFVYSSSDNHPEQSEQVTFGWWWDGDIPDSLEAVNSIAVRITVTWANVGARLLSASIAAVYS